MPGQLILSVIEAKSLAAKDDNGKSDPYVECTIGSTRKKTKIIYKTLDPVWNEDLVYEVKDVPKKLLISVWDDDEGEDPDFLGQVNLELSPNDIMKGEVIDQWFTLEKRSRRSHISGSVHLRVSFQQQGDLKTTMAPTSQSSGSLKTSTNSAQTTPSDPRSSLKISGNVTDILSSALKVSSGGTQLLKTEKYKRKTTNNKDNPPSAGAGDLIVTVYGASNLVGKDDDGFSDPFVKLTLGAQKRESFVIPKTLNPEWNEEFIFKGGDTATTTLEMTVWDDDRGGSTDFLGLVKVDISKLKPGEAIDKSSEQLKGRSLRSRVSGEITFKVERIPYSSSPRKRGALTNTQISVSEPEDEPTAVPTAASVAKSNSQAPNGSATAKPVSSAPAVTPGPSQQAAPTPVANVAAKAGAKTSGAEFSRSREVKDAKTNLYYKVIMVGDSGVGKTNIFSRYDRNHFSPTAVATVGVDFFSKVYRMDDDSLLKVQLWDTAGQERYQTVTKQYYRNSLGAVIVYDVSKRKTFQNVDQWAKELELHSQNDNLSIVLLGNKCDLPTRAVTTEEGRAKAAEKGMLFFETSALTGESIDTAFQQLLIDIHKKELQKPLEERGSKTASKNTRKKTDTPPPQQVGQTGAGGAATTAAKPQSTPAPQHTIQVAASPPQQQQEGGCPC